jgi:hypothetical protein
VNETTVIDPDVGPYPTFGALGEVSVPVVTVGPKGGEVDARNVPDAMAVTCTQTLEPAEAVVTVPPDVKFCWTTQLALIALSVQTLTL